MIRAAKDSVLRWGDKNVSQLGITEVGTSNSSQEAVSKEADAATEQGCLAGYVFWFYAIVLRSSFMLWIFLHNDFLLVQPVVETTSWQHKLYKLWYLVFFVMFIT